jgi:shikimate kinase/3-dehydroquinate synthase
VTTLDILVIAMNNKEDQSNSESKGAPPVIELTIHHPTGQYPVMIGNNLLPWLGQLSGFREPTAVITDANVGPLYLERFANLDPLAVITVPAGEANKNLETVREIYEQLLSAGFDRQGTIIALGGGVVGDMAGFVAATYMRGVQFVQCPTTVLAMVDASVGGKTGVDLPQGKNLIGAFKQPLAVVADLDTLTSLDHSVFAAGMAEVVKAGLIASPRLLDCLENELWMQNGPARSINAQPGDNEHPPDAITNLPSLIEEAIKIKRDVVESDPFESGRRKVLNLGHTFAHAIEQVSDYKISHGEAVALGLVAAVHLSAELNYCSTNLQIRVEKILTQLSLPIRIPTELPADNLLKAMYSDKKKASGRLQFVLIREVGDVFISGQVLVEAIRASMVDLRKE